MFIELLVAQAPTTGSYGFGVRKTAKSAVHPSRNEDLAIRKQRRSVVFKVDSPGGTGCRPCGCNWIDRWIVQFRSVGRTGIGDSCNNQHATIWQQCCRMKIAGGVQ